MRILILTNNDVGLYNFRKELLERLVEEKHEVIISLPQGELIPNLQAIGCKFIQTEFERRGMNPFADMKLLMKYRSILKAERPNIVLTYTIKPNVYGGIACRLTGRPYLANVTGLGTAIENKGLLNRLSMALYRAGLKEACCVFFQNRSNRDLFEQEKVIRGRSGLIPGSGVNLTRYDRKAYPPQDDGIRFLFVGRVMKDKGIDELLEAIKLVKGQRGDIAMDIVGGCDEDFGERLRQAEALGLIRYHGLQNNVPDYMRAAHCTILPSYHEGMANVLLESAATGRPVIATRVPGCAETFEEGITGLGCEPRDAGSLAEAMLRFIALPWEKKREMGLAGRQKMEREFDRDIVVDAYIREIEQIKA